MHVELNAHEARTLGVLIEKAFTTPDQYPLSLNALTNGCNQKSNRDPVVDFSEAEVTVALQGLVMKHLAGSLLPAGGRVEKFRHNAHQHLGLGDGELAVLAELLMRGPQAPGELRTRASRMRPVASLGDLAALLERLIERGHVERLPPASGSRAERYAQTLARGLHPDAPADAPRAPGATAAPPAPAPAGLGSRVEALEQEVAALRRQLRGLAEKLGEPLQDA